MSRAQKRPKVGVWPIGLMDRLPLVPVPLLPGDADVDLDIQAVVNAVYDGVGYDLILDYANPPSVPLQGEGAEWAQRIASDARKQK